MLCCHQHHLPRVPLGGPWVLQSKLNCEVLYDDLAFEVRWAVAGESVVIQLVAKLGKL